MPVNANDYIKVRHAARCLDVDRETIMKRIREGAFKAIKVGRAVRINRASFEKYIAENGV